MRPFEQAMHDRLTDTFIGYNPIGITLRRSDSQPSGAGGTIPGPEYDIPEQTMRFIVMVTQGQRASMSIAGEVIRSDFALLGHRDADIARDDKFTIDGENYRVTYVHPFDRWRVLAEAVRDG
jgi:hypothetical protein